MSSEEAKRKLNSVLNDSDVYMSIDFNTLTNRIIKGDGYFKSSIETGKGTFKTIGEERAVKERSIFGILEDCPLDEYPKYGFLSSKGQMTYEPISGWGYGDTYVRFKKNNVAPRSTFTIGDSYDGNVLFDKKRVLMAKENYEQVLKYTDASNVKAINEVKEKIAECDKILKAKYNVYRKCTPASPVNDPGLESLLHFSGNKNAASKIKEILDSGIDSLGEMSGTYVECQIYGKVSISDVSSIEISSKKQRDTLLKLLKKNNLDIDVVPCKFDSRISLLERSFTDYDDVPTRFCLSLTNKDIDNLGDYYIDGLCGRFADSRNSFWKEIKMDDTFNSLLDKVSKNKASISEKREYIKLYLSEIRKKGAGQFPKVWWENYRPKLGGWTNDVLNEELLKR